jgi:hypothetical protein
MAFSTYEKLNSQHSEIRRLKPGIGEDGGVQCELTKHTLTAKLEHRALSYAWGDPKVTKRITVNGQSFHATTNLVAALEILAHEQLPAYSIWVDAICINQNDIQERTAQVQLMGEIFKNAKPVLAWLGPEGDHSTKVIGLTRHIAEKIRSSVKGDVTFLSMPAPRSLCDTSSPNLSDETILSLALSRVRKNDFGNLFLGRSF